MKIIALMLVKNEEWILRTSIPQLWCFADEILALYTPSTDRTAELLQSFGVQIKEQPYYPTDYSLWRQMLLDWGRQRGGTHFIWLDADEAFTSNMLTEFRNDVGRLKPGQKLALQWLCLWKDARKYRQDGSAWSGLYKDFVFCDDGTSAFTGGPIFGEARTPGSNTPDHWIKLPLEEGGVLHFQFVPFERFQMKQAFRRCLEFSVDKNSPAQINMKHAITMDDEKAQCVDIPQEWLDGIVGIDELKNIGVGWYYDSIREFFDDKGIKFFEPLQIWHIQRLKEEFIKSVGREPKPVLKDPFFRRVRNRMYREWGKIKNMRKNI